MSENPTGKSRYEVILNRLNGLINDAMPNASGSPDPELPFLEMGANSLVLMDVQRTIQSEFGIEVTIGQFFEELTNIGSLVQFIDEQLEQQSTENGFDVSGHSGASNGSSGAVGSPSVSTAANGANTIPNSSSPTPSNSASGGGTGAATPDSSQSPVTGTASGSSSVDANAIKESFPSSIELPKWSGAGINSPSQSDLEAIFASQIRATSSALNELIERQLRFLNQAQGGGNFGEKLGGSGFGGEQFTGQNDGHSGTRPGGSPAVQDTGIVGGQTGQQPLIKSPADGNVSTQPPSCSISSNSSTSDQKTKPARAQSAIQPQKMLSPLEIRARGLTDIQQTHLEKLIKDFNSKTAKSKAHTQKYRSALADSRAAIGFRFSTKEMLYPLVSNRARGSRVWDLDGNEYIDISMGQGVSLFGHHPDFIESPLKEMVLNGVEMGPRPDNVGEVAELICEMTGFDRVTFTNSGTEAVMAAMRLARAATKRDKIVSFEGAWHGHADTVMGMRVEEIDGVPVTKPVSPGTPMGAVADQYVLVYDDPDSLEFIRKHGDSIAAVLVEPVQSRNPRIQPAEFLQNLRNLTKEIGALLIFDEMITGFRAHPGGAQAWFNIKADMATYGKVVGGGLPIGVVAGRSELMDPIDGGAWQYGDNSYPLVNRVVFGGTFCQHPLSMTASLAALKHLKENSPKLQHDLNGRTQKLADHLNEWFYKEEVPIQLAHFGSLFRFEFNTNLELLFYHMNLRGVFVWEWRNCFLSTAHTDEDISRIIEVVKESVNAMRDGGFIPLKSDDPSKKNGQIRSTPETFELNTAQKQLATLSGISAEGSMAYHISPLISLKGSVDEDALTTAIQGVVDRHESLRSVISDLQTQMVLPKIRVPLQKVDLSKEKNVNEACQVWLKTHACEPFDLEKGPLLQVHLLKLGINDFRLVLKGHHIILDGLSMNLLIHEIASLYNAALKKESPALAEPLQFQEYLKWQNEQPYKVQEEYWLNELSGELPKLELPADKPKPAVPTYKGGRISRDLDPELIASIRKFSTSNNATHFMTLFSMYTLWLHRLSGQSEIIVGMPVAGRSLKGGENLVGYCTHLIPIRSIYDPKETFSAYLKRMRGTLLKGYQHQDYPFARLLEKLGAAKKSNSGAPIQAIFNLDRPGDIPSFSGLEVNWMSQKVYHVAFDMVFNLTEVGNQMTLECDYSADKFDEASIERFVDYFETLARNVIRQADGEVGAVSLMSESEWESWIVKWNKTAHAYPKEQSLPELFASVAKKHAKETAVSWKNGQLSYENLNVQSNKLAHYLSENNIGVGSRVAIYLDRSPELFVAMLGVLKSGAAYVPMDKQYPKERISYMLEDAAPSMIITTSELSANVPSDSIRLILIDQDADKWSKFSEKNLSIAIVQRDTAYVMYTSGSTGNPKGTLIHHKGLLNYLTWARDYYKTTDGVGSPLHASIAFDATITSLFTPLISGRTVQIVPTDGIEIEHITRSLIDEGGNPTADWSLVKITPSHLELLNAMIPDEKKSGLTRCFVLGGEALLSKTIAPWRENASKTRIINEYGPTETVVGCAIFDEARIELPTHNVPIGKPIWNTQLYVLDQNRYPVPPGVEGELYIGGDGVADGYLNRDDLTNQRFIDVSETGLTNGSKVILKGSKSIKAGKLYQTGDRVKMLSDGNLVYLGRFDTQVKLRGFRIEPAEIESVLASIKSIKESVVTVQHLEQGDRLVAYLTLKSGAKFDRSEIQQQLSARLPEYMVPAHFEVLDAIPLNSNGKVDLKSLPKPSARTSDSNDKLADGSAEQRISTIWSNLLEVNAVGIHDNFFEIGGHSMLVLPMKDRLSKEFKTEVTPVDIFRYPTVSALANYLSPSNKPSDPSQTVQNGQNESNTAALTGRKKRSTVTFKKMG